MNMTRNKLPPRWSARDIGALSVDELRRLTRIADYTNESFNELVDAQGLLDLDWASEDAGGWCSFQDFWEEDRAKATEVFRVASEACASRHKKESD
jgi:hypothetical protein